MRRFVNSPLFAVAAICFFLPFLTVACSIDLGDELGGALGEDNPLAEIPAECTQSTVTGFNLVAGTSPDIPEECLTAAGQTEQVQPADQGRPNVFAIIAFAAAILGVGLSLLPRPIGPSLAVVLGVVGAVFLFVLRGDVAGDIPAQARAFVTVRIEYGFWLALLFFVLAAGWGLFRLVIEGPLRRRPPEAATGFGPPPSPPPEPPPP